MPGKFQNTQELRDHVNSLPLYQDFHELGEMLSTATTYGYTNRNNAPGGEDVGEFMAAFPNALKNLNKERIDDPDYDDSSDYYLGHLKNMHDLLRKPEGDTLYNHILKGVTAYDKIFPGSLQKFYNEMYRLDQFYGLELHLEEIDPEYEKALGTAKKEAGKKEEEVKKAAAKKEADELRVPSWENYDKLHTPKDGQALSMAKKKEYLAKRITASYINTLNQQGGELITPFSKGTARDEAAKLQSSWAFKHLAANAANVNENLQKDRADLAELAEDMRRPFKGLTFDERKEKIEFLHEMLQHMMPKDGRTTKYCRMYESIEQAYNNRDNLEDCDNPALNGEAALQGIFDNTEKYMKGKKSLRSKPDEQCRFDQSMDIIGCLGKGSRGAEMMAKGLIDRVNTVRSGKGQRTVNFDDLGREDCFTAHSNARRLQILEERRQREFAKKHKQAPAKKTEAKKTAAKQKPVDKQNANREKRQAKFSEYWAYKDRVKEDKFAIREVQNYPKDKNNFTTAPDHYSEANSWDTFKDAEVMNKAALRGMIASSLAVKDTNMYYNPITNELGVDHDEYLSNYKKYMNDPAVDKMAEKLNTPEARRELFDDPNGYKLHMVSTLKFDKLQEVYDGAKKEGPAINL